MNDERPRPPYEQLREALGPQHEAHSTLEALQNELDSERPEPGRITGHVDRLRGHAPIAAIVSNWWDDPRTQAFLAELSATGL